MSDGTVTATEANRQFSRLLREVEGGGRITITKDGRPVAVLVPVGDDRHEELAATLERFDALTDRGLPLDFAGGIDRDDLHRR
jgi:prevent-host-death family protein